MQNEQEIRHGQAGFRPNRSCVGYVYTLGKVIQGRKDVGRTTYCFFLDVQKVSTTQNGEMGRGKSCRKLGLEERYENGEKYDGTYEKCCDAGRGHIEQYVDILREAARGCTLSSDLFRVEMNGTLVAAEAATQVVTVEQDAVSGVMFAHDFVRISETPGGSQKQI